MEQLNLFGEDENSVQQATEGPIASERVAEMVRAFPKLYLGTSSWSFPGWKGLIYAEEYGETKLAQLGLRAYSRVGLFRTVSLDRTYYRPMTVSEYKTLSSQVPETFRFVVKAPRDLLVPGGSGFDLVRFTREFVEPTQRGLGEKLGVILIQFPPGTQAEYGSTFVSQLRELLKSLPRGPVYSLEVRDEELLGPHLQQAMIGTGCALCASIHPRLPGLDQQFLRVPPTPEVPLVFRWNLRPSLGYLEARARFRPFSSLVTEDPGRRTMLAQLALRALQAERAVYVTANNKAEGCAPLTILHFLEELSTLKNKFR